MSIDEIKTLDSEGLETRLSEIQGELENDGADIDALTAEVDAIQNRKNTLKKTAENRKALANKIAGTKVGTVIESKTTTPADVRNSAEYINAYARYIKTGKAEECRSLLTENATDGTVVVPTLVQDIVNTAWDNEPILALVKQTNLKGNVKIGFEISATDAVVHTEGADAPDEEELKLGIVTMVPETIKKWITFSDEIVDMQGAAFLDYIYSELTYRICKAAADEIIAKIIACPTEATSTSPAVKTVESTGVADFINAVSLLSDEATEPVIVMNKQSYAYYKALQLEANYNIDVFDGLDVKFNNTLDVASDGGTGTFAIVGDFGKGAQANFPNGNSIQLKYDDLSLAESDLVKIVGRLPIATAVVNNGMFVVITGAASE